MQYEGRMGCDVSQTSFFKVAYVLAYSLNLSSYGLRHATSKIYQKLPQIYVSPINAIEKFSSSKQRTSTCHRRELVPTHT